MSAPGTFNPWSLFFRDKRVANRLNNYNLIRATLKVKFVINGNAFLYGRMIAGYMPFSAGEGTGSNAITSFNLFEDIVQLSQLPHIYINPTTSTGGVITCPFFFNKNYASIPTTEIGDLGKIYYIVLNQLKHSVDPSFRTPTISVFAWAEDVQLSVLTSRDTDTLVPQAGEIDEANRTGTVSGPASTVARIANAMSSIPIIKPYAKATELAASTVATIASRFGYCRPSVTKPPDGVKLLQAGSFALTNTPDTALKLSVDHKQEATIDPRIAGIEEEDMLSIVNIAKREAYWTSFTWADSVDPGGFLWNGRVTPVVWLNGPYGEFHFPPTAMAALPFRYWTGTLKFRFQVVCSGFHKGRLAVVWDPNFISADVFELNTMYSEIIDIAETQDFTVTIANGQPFTLLPNTYPGITSYTEISSNTRYSSYEQFSNGVVGVSVINALTSPSELGDQISINVFISAGDDFKVFAPDDYFQNFIVKSPGAPSTLMASPTSVVDAPEILDEQAGDLLTTGDVDDSSPTGENMHVMFDTHVDDHTNLVFTGESIPSFRGLLKRYSLWTAFLPATNSTNNQTNNANFRFAIFPYIRGAYANAPNVTAAADNYAYCNTLLLHWITLAFAGFRGNMRYKIVNRCHWDANYPMTYIVERFGEELNGNEYDPVHRFITGGWTSISACAATVIRQSVNDHVSDYTLTGTRGLAWANTNTGVFEYEVPWYSRWRFAGGRHKPWASGNTWGLGGYYLYVKGLFTKTTALDVYVATGEDFQTYFFIGLPRLYYEPTPPAPG